MRMSLAKAGGKGICELCKGKLKEGETQLLVVTPSSRARWHIGCVEKLIRDNMHE